MNHTTQNPMADGSACGAAPSAAEETLRLIASLRAPEGLEERVYAGLIAQPRRGRILHWPSAPRLSSSWMRSAAAAAIVFVVAGGGWGIYSRVQRPQPGNVIVMPPHVATPGGFSSAGAMRTPNTLNGPVLAHPVTVPLKLVKPVTKAPAAAAQKTNRRAPASAQVAAPAVK